MDTQKSIEVGEDFIGDGLKGCSDALSVVFQVKIIDGKKYEIRYHAKLVE